MESVQVDNEIDIIQNEQVDDKGDIFQSEQLPIEPNIPQNEQVHVKGDVFQSKQLDTEVDIFQGESHSQIVYHHDSEENVQQLKEVYTDVIDGKVNGKLFF